MSPIETEAAEDDKCCKNSALQLDVDDESKYVTHYAVEVAVDYDQINSGLVEYAGIDIYAYTPASYQKYRPPLIPDDISVLYQIYLL